ncbi:MAG: DNA-deoxyinosine glycosylase [Burkholderiales bacterium]|nr:DNA-deoxyinosine glycosylase [Burkholderiales bacterium]
MTPVHSFPPVADASARILILGSMPGEESLRAGRYYAHPRNAFWRLMGDLFGAGPELPYAQRKRRLKDAGVALWDVMASCTRAGSLDSAIAEDSIVPNDFQAFFATHRNIARVFFNGGKAEHSFRKHVLPTLVAQPLQFTRLPSTSPAHAARSYAQKRAKWRIIKGN